MWNVQMNNQLHALNGDQWSTQKQKFLEWQMQQDSSIIITCLQWKNYSRLNKKKTPYIVVTFLRVGSTLQQQARIAISVYMTKIQKVSVQILGVLNGTIEDIQIESFQSNLLMITLFFQGGGTQSFIYGTFAKENLSRLYLDFMLLEILLIFGMVSCWLVAMHLKIKFKFGTTTNLLKSKQ